MKKRFVRSEHEPKMITVWGTQYPAKLSMAAMAEVEELTGKPFAVYFDSLAKNEGTIKEQAILIAACLHAGGTEVELEELMELSLDEYPAVLSQIVELISVQTPEGNGKNLG